MACGMSASGCEGDLDLDLAGGVVADGLGLDLALLDGILDGGGQQLGVDAVGQLADDQRGLVLLLDDGAEADLAAAFVVFAGIHEGALREVGDELEGLLLEDGDLRLEQFAEIVRQDARGKADGDALRAEHQQERELGGQDDGLLLAAVVGGDEFGQVVVEELRGAPGRSGGTRCSAGRRRDRRCGCCRNCPGPRSDSRG